MARTRKALNFDLDINALKKFYPGNTHTQAYHDIRGFLEKCGFEHRQGSGYVSNKPMITSDVIIIVQEMVKVYPWVSRCAKVFDITSVGKTYSAMEYMKSDIDFDFNKQEYDLDEIDIEEEYDLEI